MSAPPRYEIVTSLPLGTLHHARISRTDGTGFIRVGAAPHADPADLILTLDRATVEGLQTLAAAAAVALRQDEEAQ